MRPNMEKTGCLIRCHGEHCSSSQCCSKEKFIEDSCSDLSIKKQGQSINKKLEKKEIIPSSTTIDLKKFAIHDEENLQSCQTTINQSDGSSCQSKNKQRQSDKDNTRDESSYAINVDVNDGNHVSCTTNHSNTNPEVAL